MKNLGKISVESNSKLVGMGLTTSNYIAEYLAPIPLSGLYVKSEEGIGSTFNFYVENMKSDYLGGLEMNESLQSLKKLEKINITMLDSKFYSNSIIEEEETLKNKDDMINKYLSDQIIQNNNAVKNKFDETNIENSIILEKSKKTAYSNYNITNEKRHQITLSPVSSCVLKKNIPSLSKLASKKNDLDRHFSCILTKGPNEIKEKKDKNCDGIFVAKKKRNSISNKIQITNEELLCSFNKINSFSSKNFKSFNSELSNALHNENNMRNSIIEKFKKKLLSKNCNCPDILIVDDIFFNIIALEKMIEQFNLKIEKVLSGDEAIEKIKGFYERSSCSKTFKCFSFKCIFMDIDMPFKDGIQTTKEIIEYFKDKNYNQIIIPCTAFNDIETINKCKEVGMVDFLAKPVSIESLEHVLDKHIFTLCV